MKALRNGIIALMIVAAASSTSSAQVNRASAGKAPATPCCSITAIDASTGIVTARTTTGKSFQFKIGQAGPVDAFAARTGLGPVDAFGPVDTYIPVDGIKANPVGPVDAAKLLGSLKIGQKVWADMSGRVSLNGAEACCGAVFPSVTH